MTSNLKVGASMSTHKKEPSGNVSRRQRSNHWLVESPRHFASLRKLIPGVSQKVLTEQS